MTRSYRIFGGVFAPRSGPVLFTLCGVALMLALGGWQLQRRAWKHDLLQKIEARMQGQPMPWPQDFAAPDAFDYRRVWVTGQFRHDREMYRVARNRHEQFGYQVLTPLITEAGQAVLVNRGFVLPAKKPPANRAAGQIAGAVTITGIARVPPRVGWMMPANQPQHNLWTYIDLPAMAEFAGVKDFQPVMVEADAAPNSGGWPVGGQTRVSFPDNHLMYALTWFGMSFAFAVIFFLAHWRRES